MKYGFAFLLKYSHASYLGIHPVLSLVGVTILCHSLVYYRRIKLRALQETAELLQEAPQKVLLCLFLLIGFYKSHAVLYSPPQSIVD